MHCFSAGKQDINSTNKESLKTIILKYMMLDIDFYYSLLTINMMIN